MGRWLRILGEAWRLGPYERRLAATAGLLLPLATLGLRLLGLRRVETLLGRVPGPHRLDLPAARTIARLVHGAAGASPLPSTCLSRALVLRRLLERQGLAADLRLGVGRPGGAFAAHAWIEHAGVPLAEADDLADRFAAFPSAGGP
jgi:hypothetical protein